MRVTDCERRCGVSLEGSAALLGRNCKSGSSDEQVAGRATKASMSPSPVCANSSFAALLLHRLIYGSGHTFSLRYLSASSIRRRISSGSFNERADSNLRRVSAAKGYHSSLAGEDATKDDGTRRVRSRGGTADGSAERASHHRPEQGRHTSTETYSSCQMSSCSFPVNVSLALVVCSDSACWELSGSRRSDVPAIHPVELQLDDLPVRRLHRMHMSRLHERHGGGRWRRDSSMSAVCG